MAGCSFWDWIKCGGIVVSCATVCTAGASSPACISCFGGAYGSCKDCVSRQAAVQIAGQEQSELITIVVMQGTVRVSLIMASLL